MKKTMNRRNQRKGTDDVSTKLIQVKVTPGEQAAFHALAWFRDTTLAEHIRSLLKADLAKAESDGLREELTRARRLLADMGKPAKKRKG